MAVIYKDRVRETTQTTGSAGVYALAGAVNSYQGFSEIGTGNQCYYCCISTTEFEIGLATVTDSSTLTRDSLLQTSGTNDAAIDWTAGNKEIFNVLPEAIITLLEAHRASTSNPHTVTLEQARTAGNTLSGEVNFQDNLLTRALLKDYGEEVATPSSASNVLTLDLSTANVFNVTLDENVTTLTISNPTASGDACSFTLRLAQDGTGSHTFAWPASIDWAGGTAPTITATASRYDVYSFFTVDGGTSWSGFTAGQDLT